MEIVHHVVMLILVLLTVVVAAALVMDEEIWATCHDEVMPLQLQQLEERLP